MLVKGQPGLHVKSHFKDKKKEVPILRRFGEDSMCVAHRAQ